MDGQVVYRNAVSRMSEATLEAVEHAGLTLDDIDLFVYHQANARITRAVGERLGLAPARVVDCIERLGNSSAATLPLALSTAERDGRLRPGARVLLAAFGAGFTWGGGVIEWGSSGGELNGERVALVTGASRGIGAAIARALAGDGWAVGVNYSSDRQGAEAVVREIEAEGGRAGALAADVTDPAAPDELFGSIESGYGGPVLALINNAGDRQPTISSRPSATSSGRR